ncbi:hypothetical protein ACFL3E_00025 [Patescibacteria group bacterium]
MAEEKQNHRLIKLGEDSQLKVDLNFGVAHLVSATESCFQPHICLNEKSGVKVIDRIARDPQAANTEFWITNHVILSGKNLWLNIIFDVFLDKICWPTNLARISPRQTGYIVKNLPPESQKEVLGRIQTWYSDNFLPNITKGLDAITKQFTEGDPLLESDQHNRIFDIHGDRSIDVPYTEWEIVGENLFPAFFFHNSFNMNDQNGYLQADTFLLEMDSMVRERAESLFTLLNSLVQDK